MDENKDNDLSAALLPADPSAATSTEALPNAVEQAKEAVLKAGDKLTSIWDVTKANGWTQLAEGVDALIAAVRAESAWQPIETAPKDGTRVMVYACAHKRHWFGTGYYFKGVPGDSEGWIAHSFYTAPENDASGSFEPTHWMPMLSVPDEVKPC